MCEDAGYDQLAAIYALEQTKNDAESAIQLLATCGVVDNDESEAGKGKEKLDDVSAVRNYLKASMVITEPDQPEADPDMEKMKHNNFLAIFMYYMLLRIRNCMNFCIMCDTRLVSR